MVQTIFSKLRKEFFSQGEKSSVGGKGQVGAARKHPFSYFYLYLYLLFKGHREAESIFSSRLALKVTISQFLAGSEQVYENAYNVSFLERKIQLCQGCYNHNSNPTRLEISYIQEYYKHVRLIFFRTFFQDSHGYHSGRQVVSSATCC